MNPLHTAGKGRRGVQKYASSNLGRSRLRKIKDNGYSANGCQPKCTQPCFRNLHTLAYQRVHPCACSHWAVAQGNVSRRAAYSFRNILTVSPCLSTIVLFATSNSK